MRSSSAVWAVASVRRPRRRSSVPGVFGALGGGAGGRPGTPLGRRMTRGASDSDSSGRGRLEGTVALSGARRGAPLGWAAPAGRAAPPLLEPVSGRRGAAGASVRGAWDAGAADWPVVSVPRRRRASSSALRLRSSS
ncbi:hypothetical protein CHELA1G11_14339 [Hyphomicrobiales bacterium]|nr:hypothetical protein CHELA1G11_14339 [Hyphomicrobiales bacterium]CAH1680819.1 hypothetical protein CHELA1G2_14767 [Hyphomicrobiales bacterium]